MTEQPSISVRGDSALRQPIQLRTAEGVVHGYRFVRSVGEAPFMLSPLVRDNGEFARLFVPCEAGLWPPRVAGVRILGNKAQEVPFSLELKAVRALPRFQASAGTGERAVACKLRLVSGMDALRVRPFVRDGRRAKDKPPPGRRRWRGRRRR